MSETRERICVGCKKTDDLIRLDSCSICGRYFCADCAHRGSGRKFCSAECTHAYYFSGDSDDDEDAPDD